jgi:hypothetical protein
LGFEQSLESGAVAVRADNLHDVATGLQWLQVCEIGPAVTVEVPDACPGWLAPRLTLKQALEPRSTPVGSHNLHRVPAIGQRLQVSDVGLAISIEITNNGATVIAGRARYCGASISAVGGSVIISVLRYLSVGSTSPAFRGV